MSSSNLDIIVARVHTCVVTQSQYGSNLTVSIVSAKKTNVFTFFVTMIVVVCEIY